MDDEIKEKSKNPFNALNAVLTDFSWTNCIKATFLEQKGYFLSIF
jgi:hypothetical protein